MWVQAVRVPQQATQYRREGRRLEKRWAGQRRGGVQDVVARRVAAEHGEPALPRRVLLQAAREEGRGDVGVNGGRGGARGREGDEALNDEALEEG